MKLEILEWISEEKKQKPELLFVHGANHGAWCWQENFLPYFCSNGFSSYALSFRGHGGSDGQEQLNSYTMDDYMEDVLEVVRNMKDKPVLVGHSMGGAVVQKILYLHSKKISAAILMSSIPANGISKKYIFKYCLGFFKKVLLPSIFLGGKFGNNLKEYMGKTLFLERLPDKKREELTSRIQPESKIVKKEMFKRVVPNANGAKIPVLVLGSESDLIISEKDLMLTGKAYNTKPLIFRNLCHDMMLDPDWRLVADEILVFLNGLQN
jgi:pimeloyl-ACP methyl ester carboxylesterase